MPCNPSSEARKSHIVSLLQGRLGSFERIHPHRHDWYSSKDGKVDIFITDSKAHYDRRPWFDMRRKDIKELAGHPAGFIIFILGDDTNYLVIPAQHLRAELQNYREGRSPTKEGFYHFNLDKSVFEQLPNWNLHQYREKIDLIPLGHEQGAISN
jgi:hypothetical protein